MAVRCGYDYLLWIDIKDEGIEPEAEKQSSRVILVNLFEIVIETSGSTRDEE